MDVTTLFLQSDGQKLRQEFRNIVCTLAGRVPTSVSDANVLLQEKRIHEARKLHDEQQELIRGSRVELLSYLRQLNMLQEITATGEASVLFLGARVTGILRRMEVFLRCVRAGLVPQGPVHLITSTRPLDADELTIVRAFPQCPVAPTLELVGSLSGPEPTTEHELLEGIYKLLLHKHRVLRAASYYISIHPEPKAGTAECVTRWAVGRSVDRVVAVSGPQPWGVYQTLAVARSLRVAGFKCPVESIAYAPSEHTDVVQLVEAFAKTVYEATLK